MKKCLQTFCLIIAGLLVALPNLYAQSYAIDWFKIAGGAGTSTGGVYSVSGAIGQYDAGGAMTGGSYSLTGGSWSLISAMQTAGLPHLAITRSGNGVIISWPSADGYTLQQNNNPGGGSWTTSSYSVTTTNGTSSITITPSTGSLFFRLTHP